MQRRIWIISTACLALGLILAGIQPALAAPDYQTRAHLSPSQTAETPPIPIEEYWQMVEATHSLVLEMQGEPAENLHAALQEYAARWEVIDAVQLPEGALLPIDHSYLVKQMSADEPDLADLETTLATLLEGHRSWPKDEFSGEDILTLEAILSRPEFQWRQAQPSPFAEWWDRLRRSLGEFLARLFGDRRISAGAPLFEYGFLVLGIVVIAFVIAYALRGLWSSLVVETELDPEDGRGDQALTAETALDKAQQLSNVGDYRHAARYLYLSSLLLLEERGVLHYDRSKTNREYIRNVSGNVELSARLQEVVEVFDRVWYGYQPLDEGTYNRYARYVANLRQLK